MKKFALIGNPISHSKSPELFRKAFPGSGMSYDLIERDTVEQSIACLKEKGYGGANVTAPFKESAMQFVTDPDPVSKALGATNLILFRNDKVFSYNTDYLAVRRMVREPAFANQIILQLLSSVVAEREKPQPWPVSTKACIPSFPTAQ